MAPSDDQMTFARSRGRAGRIEFETDEFCAPALRTISTLRLPPK